MVSKTKKKSDCTYILPLLAALMHTEGQTDMSKTIGDIRDYRNAPKNCQLLDISIQS